MQAARLSERLEPLADKNTHNTGIAQLREIHHMRVTLHSARLSSNHRALSHRRTFNALTCMREDKQAERSYCGNEGLRYDMK